MVNLGDEPLLSQFRDHQLVDESGANTGARIKLQIIRQEANSSPPARQGHTARTFPPRNSANFDRTRLGR